ncbi:hypothetical protein QTH97_22855 [Variovorax sp. J22R24]|uniref:hypothetical protein n=1 Tax=Variovorax gracilis TaxID=3053502 RepID=UPI00257670C4|nr:hypothetical protein [Variovorax sp. J22R24]MDM0107804.1 hypothetical protein [Variovorax sp. J22R24]
MYEPAQVRVAVWGTGRAADEEAAAAIAEHTAAWNAEQRRRQDAEDLAALVRDALIDRLVSPAAVMCALTAEPLPERSRRQRIAAALRLLARACFPGVTSRRMQP